MRILSRIGVASMSVISTLRQCYRNLSKLYDKSRGKVWYTVRVDKHYMMDDVVQRADADTEAKTQDAQVCK